MPSVVSAATARGAARQAGWSSTEFDFDHCQSGEIDPRAAGFGLPAMPSPGLVPLQPGRATNFSTSGPGLPIHRFLAVFVRKTVSEASSNWPVKSSRWNRVVVFVASQRQLGCISCHDPHRLPAPADKAAYYRRRCLECHEKRGAPCDSQNGNPGGQARTASRATCRARTSRISHTWRRRITGSRVACPAPYPVARRTPRPARGVNAAELSLGADD